MATRGWWYYIPSPQTIVKSRRDFSGGGGFAMPPPAARPGPAAEGRRALKPTPPLLPGPGGLVLSGIFMDV